MSPDATNEACLVWSNADTSGFSSFDRIALGHGVFDTLLAQDGRIVKGKAHFERLARHAAILGISVPGNLLDIAESEITRHALRGRFRLRTTVTAGDGSPGLALPHIINPRIVMTLSPAPDPAKLPPLRAVFANIRRNETSPLSRIKSVNYGDSILAFNEARARGADDAIFLNMKGLVACATAANIFARLSDGTLATPPLSDGAMDGIVRAELVEKGAAERSLAPEDLLSAKEVFLTNSLIEARSVISIEGKDIPVTLPDRR